MALKDSATDAVPGAVMGELAGFTIPRLGMGTMALAIEGRPDRDTAIRTIHAGLNAGVRYLDTAWSYYLPSRPGTGTPEDLGYGEKLVRDALVVADGAHAGAIEHRHAHPFKVEADQAVTLA